MLLLHVLMTVYYMVSDKTPFGSKEFEDFARNWGFTLTTSSPRYPQSNGMREKAVQTLKRILKKAKNPYIALLEYRNTPDLFTFTTSYEPHGKSEDSHNQNVIATTCSNR